MKSQPTHVTFSLDKDLSDEDVKEYFLDHLDELRPALDLDVGQANDSRLEIYDIEIEEITLEIDAIHIEYSFEYGAYYGCSDANFSESDNRSISGTRSGNTFVFDVFVYPEPRDTFEEY